MAQNFFDIDLVNSLIRLINGNIFFSGGVRGGGEDHRENKTPVTVFLHPSCHHNLHEISHCLDNSIRAHNPLTEKVKRGGGEVILVNVFLCAQRGSYDS